MMKWYLRIFYSLCFLFYWVFGASQMSPQNSLYLVDLYQINPAYAGLERSLSVNFNYRDQWAGFEQNPQQLYLNANLPLYLFNGGAGIVVSSDKTGALRANSFKLSYNRIEKTGFGLLSGGLALGYSRISLDGSSLITPEGIYDNTIFSHQDPILLENSSAGSRLDYELGVFVGHRNFDLGLSLKNQFLPKNKINSVSLQSPNVMTLYGRIPLTINTLLLYPSILMKTDFQEYQTDVSILAKNGNVFGGLSLRGYSSSSLDALVLIGGIKFNSNYTISYSYDLGLSKLRGVSQGSHEININYNLNKLIGMGLPPEVIYNPRNL